MNLAPKLPLPVVASAVAVPVLLLSTDPAFRFWKSAAIAFRCLVVSAPPAIHHFTATARARFLKTGEILFPVVLFAQAKPDVRLSTLVTRSIWGMDFSMFRRGAQLQILNPVVLLISVAMVAKFNLCQWPFKLVAHYPSMLQNPAVVSSVWMRWLKDFHISSAGYVASFGSWLVFGFAPRHSKSCQVF